MRRAAAIAGLVGLLLGCASSTVTESEVAPRQTATPNEQADAERRARVRLELAAAYFARGQLDTALQEVNLAIRAKPDIAQAYDLRGLIHGAMGDSDKADADFRRALQLSPRDGDLLHNYGWYLCQQGRFADAIAQFDQALALPQYRGGARTMQARGVCQARAGQWMPAEGSLLRAYELDPGNASVAVNLAEVLYQRAEFERARFYVGRVNAQPANVNAQTLWLAARIERKLGNDRRMSELGAQLRQRFPDSTEAQRFELGRFDD